MTILQYEYSLSPSIVRVDESVIASLTMKTVMVTWRWKTMMKNEALLNEKKVHEVG